MTSSVGIKHYFDYTLAEQEILHASRIKES